MDSPLVCLATWKRERGRDIVNALAKEAPQVIVWDNGIHDWSSMPDNVTIYWSSENIGPSGRFLAALSTNAKTVILWDDDMMPKAGYYEQWSKPIDPGSIVGHHAFVGRKFRERQPVLKDGAKADYIGTGGMICMRGWCAGPIAWSGPREVKWVAEDALLCRIAVGGGGTLVAMPSLARTFDWVDEGKHAIFTERLAEREAWWNWVMENV